MWREGQCSIVQRGNLVPFVYTHVRTWKGRVCADRCPRVCGVLYDSIVALMAPLVPRACVCVGGGAHRGTCWWPSENAFDVYHPPGTRPADYISRDRADFTNTGRVEYVRAPNGGPPLRSTHVVDREEGVAPNPLFLPPPAPSRDPQRSDSFFLSSLRYVRLIHAFPGGQAWWLPLNRAWTREPRVNASIGERDIVMGSGLISRKDSLEQLWWKGDDTDFVWISIEVSTFWKITVLRGCV